MTFGVDFTNVLHKAFYTPRSQKRKKYSQAVSLFCAFGICALKTLMKLTPDFFYGLELKATNPKNRGLKLKLTREPLYIEKCFESRRLQGGKALRASVY